MKSLIGMLGIVVVILAVCLYGCTKTKPVSPLKYYTDYLKSVYDIMDKEYYLVVSKDTFDQFMEYFQNRIFPQIKGNNKIDEGIKHIATGILVSRLKSVDDPFTNFYPPQIVKDFKASVLGFGADLGIDGILKEGRFVVSHVEPRSDAFKKGISVGDQVIKIDNLLVANLKEDQVRQKISFPEGTVVPLEVFFPKTNTTASLTVISQKYFKQSVFVVPLAIPNVSCLKIKFFNEMTGQDLREIINGVNKNNIKKLILDLRDNTGGPPLAAWEISGIFLKPEEKLFYFLKKNSPPQGLLTPVSNVQYKGALAILVNKNTGSASELFSGIMQAYHRASLIGQNTAGKVYLKSLFDLSDGATLELTVAKGFLFDNNPVDNNGLKPDIKTEDDDTALKEAIAYVEKDNQP